MMKAVSPTGRVPVLRSALFEHALKGLFLGLWAYLVVLHPTWEAVGRVLLWMAGGTAVGLTLGMVQQCLRGFRPLRNLPGFLLITLLESSFFLYVGLLGGLGLGVAIETNPPEGREAWLYYFAGGGMVLGLLFAQVRRIRHNIIRLVAGAILGTGLVVFVLWGGAELEFFKPGSTQPADIEFMQLLGTLLLAGLPFFYLLLFCGETEESEVEIGVLCAALGIGLFLLRFSSRLPEIGDKLIFLVPVLLYFLYTTRLLPRLTVFKHTMRGYGFLSLGRVRDSLVSFGRALTLDRRNELATRGLYQLHRQLDLTTLDPDTIRLLNFDFCVQLAEQSLLGDASPDAEKRGESLRLLDLVETYCPQQRPRVVYLKAVANTHGKDFDLAAGYLVQLLSPESYPNSDTRNGVLYQAWDLSLRLHPELVRRIGEPHLALPGRRMEAIAATERQLRKFPEDGSVKELRNFLYAGLNETEFEQACPPSPAAPPSDFNYDHVEQIGLGLVDDPNPEKIDRGQMFLRIAAQGLPHRGPWLYTRLVQAAEQRADSAGMRRYLTDIKRIGQAVGPANLAADQKALYLAGLGKLVDDSVNRGDYQSAVDDMRLQIEAGQEDVNQLRKLAELNAKNGDVLNALLITERALLYSKTDPDLLAKKDSYYYSVDIKRVADVKEKIKSWFDVTYCVNKARKVVEQNELDVDTLDYGLHLAALACEMEPTRQSALLAQARLLLRKGDRDTAVRLLEDIREQPVGTGDEEDAWYLATRLIGDLYLNELNRPDLAITAYSAYSKYNKSGGETMFQLARAYEANGNTAAAIRTYEAVSIYQNHPRSYEASEAARRLKG